MRRNKGPPMSYSGLNALKSPPPPYLVTQVEAAMAASAWCTREELLGQVGGSTPGHPGC